MNKSVTIPNFQAAVTLRGFPSIEAVPVVNWRERAKNGEEARWFFGVSGKALIDGVGICHIEARSTGFGLNAEGEMPDLVPNSGLITGLGLKPTDSGHSVRCKVCKNAEGKLEFTGGVVTFDEAEIIKADGTPADLSAGHKYLCTTDGTKTVQFEGVELAHKVERNKASPNYGQPIWSKDEINPIPYLEVVSYTGINAVKSLRADVPQGKGVKLSDAKMIRGFSNDAEAKAARATLRAPAAPAASAAQAPGDIPLPE